MKLTLLVLTPGKQEGKALDIKTPQFLVGRDPQCQLRPASPLISKRHCAILQRDDKAFIRDFGSTNGTFVNDEPVQGERELIDGDRLKIGPIEFRVQLEAPKPTLSKTPPPPTKPVTVAKPAAKVGDTPAPATAAKKPAPAASDKGESDDDIAAMLLSLEDGDSDSPSASSSSDGSGVPEGSTMFDLKIPPEVAAQGAAPAKDAKDSKPKPGGDTRSAAAKILEDMTRRPRNKP